MMVVTPSPNFSGNSQFFVRDVTHVQEMWRRCHQATTFIILQIRHPQHPHAYTRVISTTSYTVACSCTADTYAKIGSQ